MSAAPWTDDKDEPVTPTWLDDEHPQPAPPAARRSRPGAAFDFVGKVAEMQRQLDASPFRCTCGKKVMREGTCVRCDDERREREKTERTRAAAVRTTANALPERYQGAAFGPDLAQRVRDARAIEQARAAVANPKIDRLVFGGNAGAGKTSLAAACLQMVAAERSLPGFWVDARSLSLARSRGQLGQEPELVAKAQNAGALLLDDAGLDDPQQFGSAVADVIYRRHAHGLLTLVTVARVKIGDVTLTTEETLLRYGDGIARRLLEDDGACCLVEVQR
jgi:DNA replication protein DnaC